MPKKKEKKLIEVGDPKKVATVDKGVTKVLYEGEEREVARHVEESEKEVRIDEDSVRVLNSNGDPCRIYLR